MVEKTSIEIAKHYFDVTNDVVKSYAKYLKNALEKSNIEDLKTEIEKVISGLNEYEDYLKEYVYPDLKINFSIKTKE